MRRAHQCFEATARTHALPLSGSARNGTLGGTGSDRQYPPGAGPRPRPEASEGPREMSVSISMMKKAAKVEVAQNHRGAGSPRKPLPIWRSSEMSFLHRKVVS